MGKLFGVVLRLQEPEITANCYGSGCGRGIFALLFDDDLGALVPCAQEECPHLDKQTDEPLWKDGEGRDVYLRRLLACGLTKKLSSRPLNNRSKHDERKHTAA